jgi:hypothetical protein
MNQKKRRNEIMEEEIMGGAWSNDEFEDEEED